MKLPVSVQHFAEIRDPKKNYIYVDKTKQITDLIGLGKAAYLSRPRRFGKSLMLDTMQCLFECKRELFTGLYADNDEVWDWGSPHPVIKIDCTGMVCNSVEILNAKWSLIFSKICTYHGIDYETIKSIDPVSEFEFLIDAVVKKYGVSAVVIVDEYDFPLVHNLHKPELAREVRDVLGGIYSILKTLSGNLHYVMISGVSKFMKLSLFSMANQLKDQSIHSKTATICGYTHEEFQHNFAEYLDDVDLERVKHWYNGYNFLGEALYNPYDILLFLDEKMYRNYWWQTGGTTLLSYLLKTQQPALPEIEGQLYSDEILNAFDIEEENIIALLWQSGYLTFEAQVEKNDQIKYKMKYPNREVQCSLNTLFLQVLSQNKMIELKSDYLIDALQSYDPERIKAQFNALLASLLRHSYTNNDMARYEGYYSNVIYASFFYLSAYRAHTELMTQNGRIDFSLEGKDEIFVIEYKVKGSAEQAITQIEDKGYAQRYAHSNKPIYLLGISFDPEQRLIDAVVLKKKVLIN